MNSNTSKPRHGVLAIGIATLATYASPLLAHAGPAPKPRDTAGPATEVVVTGTRRTGVEALDSPAPIEVLDSTVLERLGQPDLIQAIAQHVPSFTAQAFSADTGNLTPSGKLRGLSPNHTLVLVDGKRRHTTGNLGVLGGPYQGGASADLNFIPVSAIERVEVLHDGAAAQYGTDAIAGVINVILRRSPSGGAVALGGGGYLDGGGDTGTAVANAGFDMGGRGSYLNVAVELRTHDHSDRSGIDPRVVNPANLATMPMLLQVPGYPHVNHIEGDPKSSLTIAAYNGGLNLSDSVQLYSFGTYGVRHAQAYANYRMPNRLPTIYPLGFNPKVESHEHDFGTTLGLKGRLRGNWDWDLSSTYGRDDIAVDTIDSGNIALFADTGSTPTDFHSGDFIASQWTQNLDLRGDFELGLASPLNVAFGAEQRHETYETRAGDPASRYKEGAQAYPGFALTDAGRHSRDNVATYVDLSLSPIDKLQVDLAGRYEHFSDFGDTTVGKLSARYEVTRTFALRSTFSTGFRAPTLAEEHYSATNVSPASAFVQLPPNSAAASLIGVDGLAPEKSRQFSAGLVLRPTERLSATLDAYDIKVDDRIVGSGSLLGRGGAVNSQAVVDAIAANGNVLDPTVTFVGINVFSNGLDTRTRGADLAMSYAMDVSLGRIDWSWRANVTDTRVTRINPTPAPLAPQALFNRTAISNLETTPPKYRTTLGASWSHDRFSVNLRETIYGPASRLESPNGAVFYEVSTGTLPVTDLELEYRAAALTLSMGANNVFNRYPDAVNESLLAVYRAQGNPAAVSVYPWFSPLSINGGYYYGRLTYRF
jgi:iron complex outermembrane receptor protein